MKREHLTNVETEAQCQALARDAVWEARCLSRERGRRAVRLSRSIIARMADRIIELRMSEMVCLDCGSIGSFV